MTWGSPTFDPEHATAGCSLIQTSEWMTLIDLLKDTDQTSFKKEIEIDTTFNLGVDVVQLIDSSFEWESVSQYYYDVRFYSKDDIRFAATEAERRRRQAAESYSEGLARRDEKKWPEAVAAFQNCVALDANHSDAWYQLGYAYRQQNGKSCEASYEPYTRCIALDPKHVAAHANLGILLLHVRKDHDGAERYFRKAIELDPKYANAHWNLSWILEEQKNDIPGAIKLVEDFVRLGGIPPNKLHDGEQRLARLRAKLK